MKNLLPYLKNKYIITLILAFIWLVFFESQDLISQYNSLQQQKELIREREAQKKKVAEIKQALQELNNPNTLEKFAREKYYFKKDNEDLFVIIKK